MRKFFNDENGFVLTAELVIIATLVFCGVIVGLSMVRDALVTELGDISEAVGALNQSYNYRSLTGVGGAVGTDHGSCSGSGYNDEADECDCKGITFGAVCGKEDPSLENNPEGT